MSEARHECPNCGRPTDPQALNGHCVRCLALNFFGSAGMDEAGEVVDLETEVPGLSLGGVRRFGGYELLEELGRGGAGVVYRARQVGLGREVALKFLLAGALAGDRAIARFRAEAAAAAELRHPNIVTVYEVGEVGSRHFFSMELVAGRTLADLVRDGPMPVVRAASYLARVAGAVAHAHGRGVLHRDLKPSNVLVDERDEPRVTDFGLAKREGESLELTGTGQVLGTPAYMSPEQAAGGASTVDARSDVYSLGAILYHLVTARPPFIGETATSILRQVTDSDPVPPRLMNPSVPRDLETVCLQCLAKDPSRRYGTAAALAEDLERFLKGEPVAARPQGSAEKAVRWCRRRPALAGAMAGLVLLAIAIVGVSTRSARQMDRLRLQTLTNLYASDLRLAHQMVADHHFGAVQEVLDRHRPRAGNPDLRGFEWEHLDALCASDEVATLGTQPDHVQRMAVSADGRWLASGSTVLKVWDPATRREVMSRTLEDYTWAVAFSPEGREVVAVTPEQPWLRFGVEGNAALAVPPGSTGRVVAIAWPTNAVGPLFLSPGRLRQWDLQKGTLVERGELPPGTARAFVTRDGRGAALILGRSEAAIWELDPPREIARHDLPVATRTAVWIRSRNRTVGGDLSGSLHVWEGTNRTAVRVLPAHRGMIECLALSPDEGLLATAGADQVIRIWNTDTLEQVGRRQGHRAFVFGLTFSADGKSLFSGDRLGVVKMWGLDEAAGNPAMASGTNAYVSQDGSRMVFAGTNGVVQVRDSGHPWSGGEELKVEPGWRLLPTREGFLARDRLGGLHRRGTDGAWSDVGGTGLRVAYGAVASPTGRFVVHRPDGTADCSVLELPEAKEVLRLTNNPSWLAPTFSTDERRFCVGNGAGMVQVFGLPEGHFLGEIQAHTGYAYACDLNRDGSLLATAGFDGFVRVWRVPGGERLAELRSTADSFWTVALSPDGRRVAAGTGDSRVVLWDAQSQLELGILPFGPPLLPVEGLLRFSRDGRTLTLGGARWRTWGSFKAQD